MASTIQSSMIKEKEPIKQTETLKNCHALKSVYWLASKMWWPRLGAKQRVQDLFPNKCKMNSTRKKERAKKVDGECEWGNLN